MSDIETFYLPGIGPITPENLVHQYKGDFSQLFPRGKDEVTIAAHRGTWEQAGTAQNSTGAIKASTNIPGIDHIELDIRSTRDYHPILFHDDKPQALLHGISKRFTLKTENSAGDEVKLKRSEIGTYDFLWEDMKKYRLNDRFGKRTSETVVDLDKALDLFRRRKIKMPINLDLGIPSFGGKVPQAGEKVDGQPFYERIFLEMIRLVCKKKMTDQIIFKGKFPWDHPIWVDVRSILWSFSKRRGNSTGVAPKIAYMPKGGEELQNPPGNPDQTLEGYYNDWLDVYDGKKKVPGVEIVGFEPRMKTDADTYADEIKKVIAAAKQRNLKVGVFAEATTSCQGYWTKSARERYIDFDEDYRNNFEWVLDQGYDYVITELAESLVSLRKRRGISEINKASKIGEKHSLDLSQLRADGFTIGFSLNMRDLKSETGIKWLATISNELIPGSEILWGLGIDASTKKLFVRRVIGDGKQIDYFYDIDFWQPPFANFSDYSGKQKIYFYLVQETGQMRLHVAMPDGKFDCMYLDYGLENTLFNSLDHQVSSLGFIFDDILAQDRYVTLDAMWRTDVYQHAIDHYFSEIGKKQSRTSFSLLEHTNPYFGDSDAANDKKVNDDDVKRLGKCNSFQDSFLSPSGRMSLEAAEPEVDSVITSVFSFYPNPNKGVVNLELGTMSEESNQVVLALYDLQGKLAVSETVELLPGQSLITWDLIEKGLPASGVYVLKARTVNGTYSGRIIMDCGCGK